jgi:hypothetical protein
MVINEGASLRHAAWCTVFVMMCLNLPMKASLASDRSRIADEGKPETRTTTGDALMISDCFQVEGEVIFVCHDHKSCHSSAHRATFMYNSLTVLALGREALAALTKMAMAVVPGTLADCHAGPGEEKREWR